MGVTICAMLVSTSTIQNDLRLVCRPRSWIVNHNRSLVTLYCTLSHFSTLFDHKGPAVGTVMRHGVIYFTLYYTLCTICYTIDLE